MIYPEKIREKLYGAFIAIAVAALALAPRIAMLLTVERAPDADESVVGLMAKHISEMKGVPLFFYGQHYGGGHVIEALAAAIGFFITGPSAFIVQLVPALFSVGLVMLVYVFAGRIYGRRAAVWAALALAFSTPFLKSSLKADGYIETIFFCFFAAYMLHRLNESLPSTAEDGSQTGNEWHALRYSLLLAFFCGLAWWSYDFSLLITAAIGLIFLARRMLRSFLHLIILAMGFALGAAPLIYDNLQNNYANLRHLFGGAAPSGSLIRHAAASAERLFTVQLPAFFTRDCVHNFVYPPPPEAWVYSGLLLFSILALFQMRGRSRMPGVWALAPALYAVFYCVSAFSGSLPSELPSEFNRAPMIYGVSPRYLLPLEPYITLFIAVALGSMIASRHAVSRYLGRLASLAFAAVLLTGLISIFQDNTVVEGNIKTSPDSIPRVVKFLEKHDIDCVNTTYFIKWRILFESREKINAMDMLISTGRKESDFTPYEDSGCPSGKPPVYVLNSSSPMLADIAMLAGGRHVKYAMWRTKDHIVIFPVSKK